MGEDLIFRPTFYEKQYLGAADLNAAVAYASRHEARHRLASHTWGVASGLELVEQIGPGGVMTAFVLPGYAHDGFGRPIAVMQPAALTNDKLRPFDVPGDPATLLLVCLVYRETAGFGVRPGFEDCDGEGGFARMQESFDIQVTDFVANPVLHTPVEGYAPPPGSAAKMPPEPMDESFPAQTLPLDAARVFWRVPIGIVKFQPGIGLQPRSDAEKLVSRQAVRYAGAVAEAIHAPDGVLRLKDRRKISLLRKADSPVTVDDPAYDPTAYPETKTPGDPPDDLVWIEGDLRVIGNARIFGGDIEFKSAAGTNADAQPVRLSRQKHGGNELHAIIGKDNVGNNRLVVGPLGGAGKTQPVLSVFDNNVLTLGDIASTLGDPIIRFDRNAAANNARFHNDADGRLLIEAADLRLNAATIAQVNGPRLEANVATMFVQGKLGVGVAAPLPPLHITEQGLQIGANGTATDNFHLASDAVNGPRALRLYNGNFGAGAPLLTVTPGGTIGIGTTSPDAGLRLDVAGDFGHNTSPTTVHLMGSRIGDVADGVLFLRSGGGVVAMDDPGDLVGIGTNNPQEKLDVRGDIRLGAFGNLFAVTGGPRLHIVGGVVTATGGFTAGLGFQASRFATGRYSLTFDTPFLNPPAASVTQIFQVGGGVPGSALDNAVIVTLSNSNMTVVMGDSSGSPDNRAFTFIVIGLRA